MKTRTLALVGSLLIGLAAGGCSADDNNDASPSDDTTEITVFAAASLNAAFPEIAEEVFTESHPDVVVRFAFEGSSSLAEKLQSGASADVFASANEANMTKVTDAGLAAEPTKLTTNTLRLIVPAGNPAGVTDLESANAAKFVVCAPQVPCGAASQELAQAEGITLQPVSEEQSVSDVRAKVESGEADAGLVYLTDALLAGDAVDIVDAPGVAAVGTTYMITALSDAPNPELAKAFIDAVMSDAGQEIMAKYGFGETAK
ncbi:molybdate ABC transporter substrate-binding protein [Trueperella bialowiezensis]|uniref:Molybdate-binding periplasmic protein n=1 Tax=Trueperella bialowiezensis TaxID=312285 RepID=A0A3S4VFU1_9ACTO|nr:molybdate ABC transporter substrate-binding protein [Trueperella bialowiezensis]VEI13175.1 Molybdate-binding periplasmic protein precursor [Trueperella bialowiezensis]